MMQHPQAPATADAVAQKIQNDLKALLAKAAQSAQSRADATPSEAPGHHQQPTEQPAKP